MNLDESQGVNDFDRLSFDYEELRRARKRSWLMSTLVLPFDSNISIRSKASR